MTKQLATADTKLTVLNDHYKETQRIVEQSVKSRDRNFFLILVLLGVMAFQLFSPQESGSLLSQIVKNQLNVDASISLAYIGSLIWFGLFAVSIRYFQLVIGLERQYNYIHDLESQLANEYAGKAFSREGKSYLKNYPLFFEWLHFVYRSVFPLLLIAAATVKIASEIRPQCINSLPLGFNSVIYLMLVISTVLYVYSMKKIYKDGE